MDTNAASIGAMGRWCDGRKVGMCGFDADRRRIGIGDVAATDSLRYSENCVISGAPRLIARASVHLGLTPSYRGGPIDSANGGTRRHVPRSSSPPTNGGYTTPQVRGGLITHVGERQLNCLTIAPRLS